jgi:hypothetical protein
MTILELATFACQTVGDVSPETMEFAKKAVRLKYSVMYDAHAWRESMRLLDGYPLDQDGLGRIFLPLDAEEVIFLSLSTDGVNYTRLAYRERDWIERFALNAAAVAGRQPFYYRAENLAWPHLNPGKLTFTTYDPALFVLFISGLDANGNTVQETYKMQGAINPDTTVNPAIVTTVNSYAQINVLSKGGTTQPLMVLPQFPGASTPTTIPASMSAAIYTHLVLYPAPPASQQLYYRVQVKLKPDPLDSDYSVPRVSHVTDALIEFTLAALYKKSRQLAKADNSEQKGIAHIQAAVQIEKNQSEMRQQVVPTLYDTGDYLNEGDYVRLTSSYPWP